MPEYSHVQTYVRCNQDNFIQIIKEFRDTLLSIGFDSEYLESSFADLEWKIEDDGFVYCGCSCETKRINFNGIEVNIRPYIMGWTPNVLPKLTESWVEICLLFESEEIIENFENRRIREDIQGVLLNIMKIFSCKFFETGIYFTDEIMDGVPWESIFGENDNLWGFDAAIVRTDMNDIYCPTYNDFIKKIMDDKIYISNEDTMRNFNKLV